MGRSLYWLIAFYAVMCIVAIFLYGSDKRKAKRHKWRIPESVLLGVGLLGGAIGALIGMKCFRHKTRHWYFWAVNVFAIAAHAFLIWKFHEFF